MKIARSLVLALGLIGGLAGCDSFTIEAIRHHLKISEPGTYTDVPASQRWISVPGSRVALQRSVMGEEEQRVLLDNNTAVPGENELILRAYGSADRPAGKLNFETLRTRLGGFPDPFAEVRSEDFRTGSDAFGGYVWIGRGYGSTVSCVLAFRRLDAETRLIPSDRSFLDVVLRNCVTGTAQDALAPILAQNIGYGRTSAYSDHSGSRLLSPLAGPLP